VKKIARTSPAPVAKTGPYQAVAAAITGTIGMVELGSAAVLRRSELHRRPQLEPSGIFLHLYLISTAHNSSSRTRLFLNAFPPYPELISNSRR
jgi:hypothetical protein